MDNNTLLKKKKKQLVKKKVEYDRYKKNKLVQTIPSVRFRFKQMQLHRYYVPLLARVYTSVLMEMKCISFFGRKIKYYILFDAYGTIGV